MPTTGVSTTKPHKRVPIQLLPPGWIAMPMSRSAIHPAVIKPTYPSQASCRRSSALAPRRLANTEATDRTPLITARPTITATRLLNQPCRGKIPSGFGKLTPATSNELVNPPVTVAPTCSCAAAEPARMTNIAHRTGRHRRDGSRPSGNNNIRKNSRKIVGTVRAWENPPGQLGRGHRARGRGQPVQRVLLRHHGDRQRQPDQAKQPADGISGK